uniref:translocation/assembly module TamB domain-containing protein n=1 Tax=Pedobacter schmidteae TaxID=2201271 RepID=UPI000EAFD91F|nr:translocation/assembly module TamB [Pedobacter schmidteae]
MNKYVRKSLKILLWCIASIVLLLVLIALSLNIPAVQNFVKDKAINYLKEKTKTEISLESIKIGLPKDIILNKFYIEDKKGDTLLYAQKLAVDISLFKLLYNKVEVNNITLQKIRANVTRIHPDTTFNFSFLADAFMSEQTKPEAEVEKDSTSTLKFSVSRINLEDIGIVYRDDVAGNDMKLNLGEFKANIKDFDLEKQHYVIKSLNLSNTSVSYLQQKPLTQLQAHIANSIDTTKTESGKLPQVEIQDFTFNKVKIGFNDQLSRTSANVDLNSLALTKLFIDLTNNLYKVEEGKINNTKVDFRTATSAMQAKVNLNEFALTQLIADVTRSKYQLNEASLNHSDVVFAFKPVPAEKTVVKKDTVPPAPGIALLLNRVNLADNNIKFDNLAEKPGKRMDFNHLQIRKLSLQAEKIAYSDAGILVNLKSGSLKEQSGFELLKLQGDVAYTQKQTKINNLILKTPNTSIDNNTQLDYTSMDDLTKHPERVKIYTQVKNTSIGLKDAAYFSDAVPENYRNEKIRVTALAHGYMNNLVIPKLQVDGLKSTHIDISGTARGLPDVNKTVLNLNIKRFALTKNDLLVLIPKKSLPTNITLPNTINATGQFAGSMTNFNTGFNINTDMGSARLLASMKGPKGKENYTANINLNNFNVGKLLKMEPQLGRITAKANVKGSGLDAKKASATINGQVISAYYNKYNYHNLNLKGTYARQKLDLKSNMADTNANFGLTAHIDISGKYPSVKANANLKQIDLQKLNFSPTEFKLAGLIKADIQTADPDFLNGDITINGMQLVKEGQHFNVDTILVHAEATDNHNLLTLRSEFLRAKIDGKYQLTNLGAAVINQINKYYQFGTVTKIPDQRFRFYVNFYNPKILKNLIPELSTFAPSRMGGLLDTQKDSLMINAVFPQVVYGSYRVDSTRLNINNDNQKLNYKLTIKSLQSPALSFFNNEISGAAVNNNLDLNIFLRDSKRKDKYVLGGLFTSINKDFRFSFDPQKVLLNYEKWTVAPENYLQFGASGILANQFNLSNGGQLLSINSESNTPNAPLKVTFKDFRIETLTRFAEADSAMAGGAINGTVDVKDLAGTPKFEANLTVDQLRYQKDMLGTLRIAVNNNTENAFETNIALSGVHELRASGFYYTAPESALDLTLNIDKIDLKAIESLSMGQIRKGTGTVSGQLSVKGNLDAPKVLGDLKFNQAGFNVAYVNSFFRMPNETISFTDTGINFNKFTILDSLNQKAIITGGILTSNYRDFKFNMDIRTTNFRALNSTAEDNEMIYGTVYLTSTIKVRGDMNQPSVDMNVRVEDKTKFFFAMPPDDPSIIDQEGIVQYVDFDAPPFNGRKALTAADSISKSPIKGFNLSATIHIDENAELNVVVDPTNGDALKVKGQATLAATMDPSGKTSLTGRYEISDGSYNLSVGPVKRAFKLQQGSNIVWTGEPTEANVNLTALYEVNAAPIDLLNDPSQTTAKTKLPFQVYLMMTGELMKPIIKFKLDLPENERGALGGTVYTKLQRVNTDDGELNKQVFALLVLERFIADNPFQSLAGGGVNVGSIARSSVSKLLTEQLNNLTSSLVKGVDINFNLNSSEDYSTGQLQQKTDLEIGLSKKLLSDRLIVTVGSSFGLEGTQQQQNSTNIAGNVNIEYLLSRDGRYRLRAYRRNQNEGVIEGQIIETGLGFALVVDYNKFKEVFQKFSKKKRIRLEQSAKDETTN